MLSPMRLVVPFSSERNSFRLMFASRRDDREPAERSLHCGSPAFSRDTRNEPGQLLLLPFSFCLDLRPGISKRNNAIEDKFVLGAVRVDHVVTQSLKLNAIIDVRLR